MSELALKLIAEAKRTRATRIDLGNCDLTELPEELFELTWLEELIISSSWNEYSLKEKKDKWKNSKNIDYFNKIKAFPKAINRLKK